MCVDTSNGRADIDTEYCKHRCSGRRPVKRMEGREWKEENGRKRMEGREEARGTMTNYVI